MENQPLVSQRITQSGNHVSFEFFPPKDAGDLEKLYGVIRDLAGHGPDFVSVTWGAGGSTVGQSLEVASKIANSIRATCLAHFTGLGMTQKTVDELLGELKKRGIRNILALRGDVPHQIPQAKPPPGAFRHASELVEYIRSGKENAADKLGILVAGCPEGHPEAVSFSSDMDFLAQKVRKGADGIITQFFFDNAKFFRFTDELKKRKVNVPVLVGIMIATKVKMIEKMNELSRCSYPKELEDAFARFKNDDKSMEKFGIEFAVRQIEELRQSGVRHFHFYTMNRKGPVEAVLSRLSGFA